MQARDADPVNFNRIRSILTGSGSYTQKRNSCKQREQNKEFIIKKKISTLEHFTTFIAYLIQFKFFPVLYMDTY